MNSRLIRTLIVVIGIAIGLTASYLLKNIDTDINGQRSSADAVRAQAAALSATIADVRGGQFAYVARGQGEAFWMSHVESLMPALQKQAAELRRVAGVAGRPKRVRAGGGRTREFPYARYQGQGIRA